MNPRFLLSGCSLLVLHQETFYTQARIEADPSTTDLAPPLSDLLARVNTAITFELTLDGDAVKAQALVDYHQEIIGGHIFELAGDLLRYVDNDRTDHFETAIGTPSRIGVAHYAPEKSTPRSSPDRRVGVSAFLQARR